MLCRLSVSANPNPKQGTATDMPRPEAWRTDIAAYPFSATTETRFQDLDVLGHINNVAMAALFENGRVRFNRSLGSDLHEKGSPKG